MPRRALQIPAFFKARLIKFMLPEPPAKKRRTMPSTVDNPEIPVLKFKKVTEDACTPTRGSPLSAGYDLYSARECIVPPKGKALVKTDLQISLPDGCYGRVAPRSGLALKHFIDVGAGVIDQDYRGDVGVVLFNFGEKEFPVKRGERIAQLICEKIFLPELQELKELDATERGDGGFGSTGRS